MDISATLTAEEIGALSDPERTLEAARELSDKIHGRNRRLDIQPDGVSFEESLRLKNTLDRVEEQAKSEPSWPHLSVLLNCEYQLYKLNQFTPLRHNPFLSHWVEAIQRLANILLRQSSQAKDGGSEPGSLITPAEISLARAELIKALLQSRGTSQFSRLTPTDLYESAVKLQQRTAFKLSPYIRMLEEEGIYEPTSSSSEGQPATSDESQEKSQDAPKLSDAQKWNQTMLARLEHQPDATIPVLTHLPISLPYLDFLTKLLQEQTLQRLSIEPSPLIRDYIQHALRLAEQMGQPPTRDMAEASSGLSVEGEDGEVREGSVGSEHGREAQIRAVKLLLLFIRNLIRKALLPPEDIYFEIQEICVRYVWIREVREFRAFIEEGAGGDQAFV
ncbi:hypothetical protein K469DRAFT_587830 [Zopfia rhizophila CBS 207.26]|uniref:Uncharacterized protein n=1 Tax=Zopfia rhizophila CBS 207.26 TaxID=1314779 RepID=A0A6A6DQR7_9PEZI|nr:hypothetical protein K469DRAFT_587830 [Zopfia rhizophila CBS 207.26]